MPEPLPPARDLTTEPPIDLTTGTPGEGVDDKDVPHHSPRWAGIVKPFTWFVLGLIAVVMLLPFWMLWLLAEESKRLTPMLDWAKTILPSVTGFGGAIIGYYFGTRGGKGDEG